MVNKVVIFDWGGVVENHENDLQDLKEAKIHLIKSFNADISEEDILAGWIDTTFSGYIYSFFET